MTKIKIDIGSEKQRAWAEKIREGLLEKYELEKNDLTEEGQKIFEKIISCCANSVIYINSRDFNNSIDDFLAWMITENKAYCY